MSDSIEKIADSLNALAAVIRKHGTCAPAALEEMASRARSLRQGAEGDPVAWTVVGPDGKSSIGGWSDMSSHRVMSEIGILRDGHRYAYAYEANPAPPDSGEK